MATKERSGAGAGATLLGRTRVWPIALAVAICVAGPAAVAHARALASAPGPENSPLGLARNYVTVDVGADPLQVQKTLLESAFAYGDLASGGAYATRGAASSAANGLRLGKQLASEAGSAQLLAGGGKAMAGAGTGSPIRDVGRLVSEYGGKAGDWAKVTSGAQKFSDLTTIEVHGYRNVVTGETIELKSKIGGWSP